MNIHMSADGKSLCGEATRADAGTLNRQIVNCVKCLERIRMVRKMGKRVSKRRLIASASGRIQRRGDIDRLGIVYFIQAENMPESPIKIGYSAEPTGMNRISELQTAYPYRLRYIALIPGTRRNERSAHKMLETSRLEGEWFKPTPELHALLARLETREGWPNDERRF